VILPGVAASRSPIVLVMVGVRTDGSKELVAVADGYRESTKSWADLLRDCKRRGMRAPVLPGKMWCRVRPHMRVLPG
jgi:hypothetical protein